jgi:serine/threonine protein kinase
MSSDARPSDPTIAAGDAAIEQDEGLPTIVAGRYEILGLIGAGGMGRVYRAKDRVLSEVVALKVLHRDLVQSAEMVERFRQEVRLARKVTHRNVARTFDIGQHDGDEFLTMELIAGRRSPRGSIAASRRSPTRSPSHAKSSPE